MCSSTLQSPYTGTISFLALQVRWMVADQLVSGYTMQKSERWAFVRTARIGKRYSGFFHI